MAQFSIELKCWPTLTRYMAQIGQRKSVQAALTAEAASREVE
jgi:glutathione S-transferase